MIKNIIKGIMYTPGIIFVGWFIISWFEVMCKNLEKSPLSFLNFFSVFL